MWQLELNLTAATCVDNDSTSYASRKRGTNDSVKDPLTAYHHHGTSDRAHISYGAVDVLLPGSPECVAVYAAPRRGCVCSCGRVHATACCAAMRDCAAPILLLHWGAGLPPAFSNRVVEILAKSDVMLVNLVSRSENRIPVEATSEGNEPLHSLLRVSTPPPPLRLASGLDKISAESLLVLFYLLLIKCICGLLGLCVVNLVLWAPVALFQLLFVSVASHGDFAFWESVCGTFTLLLVFAVAVFSLDMLVSLSCATTLFFYCERGVRTLSHPPGSAAVSEVHPQSNVMVVRCAPSSASSCNESIVSPTSVGVPSLFMETQPV
ncbi:hypothetical protein FI667_g15340, partial [Globisporangium splendens]